MRKTRIVYRVDGGVKEGYGHIYRGINLQKVFQKNRDVKIFFLVKKDLRGYQFLKKKIKKNVFFIKNIKNEFEIITSLSPKLVIFDTLNTEKRLFKLLVKKKFRIAVFEDFGNKAKNFANLIFNCNSEGPIKKIKKIKRGTKYLGAPYKIFGPKIEKYRNLKKNNQMLTISFGGGEVHKGEILNLIRKLHNSLKIYNLKINLILGPGVKNSTIKILKKENFNIKIYQDLKNIYSLLNKSKFLITGGGGTVYEGAYFKCKIFCFARNSHQKENIKKFEKNKLCIEIKKLDKNYLFNFFRNNLSFKNKSRNKKFSSNIIKNNGLYLVKRILLKQLNDN